MILQVPASPPEQSWTRNCVRVSSCPQAVHYLNAADSCFQFLITRNQVTFLYVLLECFKWISTYFKANNAINSYNIDSL